MRKGQCADNFKCLNTDIHRCNARTIMDESIDPGLFFVVCWNDGVLVARYQETNNEK
jgi:hypothetical protein